MTGHASYEGRVGLPMNDRFETVVSHEVIRDEEAYAAFVERIPTVSIQKKQPAPPSTDPLLKRPEVDFTHHMVLVAQRDDMYVGPTITGLEADGEGWVVTVALPDLGDERFAARMEGIGTYHAIVVDRVEGPVRWRTAP